MKQRSPRPTAQLSPWLLRRVNSYALAASAAGMGALGLAQPVEGKIVYTPANVKIIPNHGLITFDLNHDGIADFGLSNRTFATSFRDKYGTLRFQDAQSANEVWTVTSDNGRRLSPAPLPKGKLVGPKGQFQTDPRSLVMAEVYFGTAYGPWLKVKQGFLGLKFVFKGKIHYGWARLKVDIRLTSFSATLTGYAYETVPNKAIIAGRTKGLDAIAAEPATLGQLARGAGAISGWRVKQVSATTR
jgi:hypothetical protein